MMGVRRGERPSLLSRPPASLTRGEMKPSSANFTANLLTCYPREAGANLLNSFENPNLSLVQELPRFQPNLNPVSS